MPARTKEQMNITIILGSVRQERQSHRLAYFLRNKLNELGQDTKIVDLTLTPLPIYGQVGTDISNVENIGSVISKAEALIFVTPEYHGSYSGALKNLLDYYWREFHKKPIGVATASAGKMAGINASTHLQQLILSLGAYPMPLKLLVPEIQSAFSDDYSSLNSSVTKDAKKFIDEFLWFSEAIVTKKEATLLLEKTKK
ncbi:NADPH-dependent FMN reductase [Neotamlana sedimentorum]|nr:NADPH-dependent FMN reductase [Tamlana sedimentorum]